MIPAREGGGARLRRLLDQRFGRSKKVKTHTYFMLAGPIGMQLFNACDDLNKDVSRACKSVLYVCSLLYEKQHRVQDLSKLEALVVEAITLVEQRLSCTELDIKLHNLIHLVQHIKDQGPLHVTAMWAYEAMWSKIG